ncbi:hypothetical protein J6590_102238 [Homalodisca vitripennis]|nr:hypothetical protein J6590_102238 [Homalodisca vitripennis]
MFRGNSSESTEHGSDISAAEKGMDSYHPLTSPFILIHHRFIQDWQSKSKFSQSTSVLWA